METQPPAALPFYIKPPEVELAETTANLVYFYTLFIKRNVDGVISPLQWVQREQLLNLRRLIREQSQQIKSLWLGVEVIGIWTHCINILLGEVAPELKPVAIKPTTVPDTVTKLKAFLERIKSLNNNIDDPSLHTSDNRFQMIELQRLVQMDQSVIISQWLMPTGDFLHATTHLKAVIDYDITAHAS
jgi:hypothetical protein